MCNCGKNRRAPTVTPRSIPIEVSYDTALWGPTLWTILHTLAEFSDRYDVLIYWSEIINDIMRSALPCPECRGHYNAWIATHPLILMDGVTTANLRSTVRQWLLDLHNQVNTTKSTPTPTWTESQLTPTYGGDRTSRIGEVYGLLDSIAEYFPQRFIVMLRAVADLLR